LRLTNKIITKTEIVPVTKTAVKEELSEIYENKTNQVINVTISYFDANGDDIDFKQLAIEGDDYYLLMSANPTFAPEKPENEYREVDLWYIIDQIS
jgi:hypothetical protein